VRQLIVGDLLGVLLDCGGFECNLGSSSNRSGARAGIGVGEPCAGNRSQVIFRFQILKI
jgi:hypothetical protein